MAFIIRHTSGIVCAPLPLAEARRLRLDPMVSLNDAPLGTAFTVSVDVRHGLTTGISAEERTNTVRALANGNMGASDFVRPGHVFPLIAKDGGVLMRSGHTEACVDLCRLAGVAPVGVLAELVNDNGTVMKGKQVIDFAKKHKLQFLTVADLIAYRQSREKLVERVATFQVDTQIGPLQGHAFVTPFDIVNHYAFVHGEIGDGREVLTRLHRADVVGDVLGGGKVVSAALGRYQGGRSGNPGLSEGRDGRRPDRCAPGRGRSWIGLAAQSPMARNRPGSANSTGSGRLLHQVALVAGADLCRPVGVRDRDREDRGDRGLANRCDVNGSASTA